MKHIHFDIESNGAGGKKMTLPLDKSRGSVNANSVLKSRF